MLAVDQSAGDAQSARPAALPRPAAIEWLCLVAGSALTLAYSWLLDDAFVFFRYVDNLLFLERGLVFNEGEYVEGFSSPAWALLLIPLRATGMNYWLIVRGLGVAMFVCFWLLLLALRRATEPTAAAGSAAQVPVINLPLLFLSVLYPVACYFTSGMETGLVQICAAAFALHAFRPELRLPQVLVGLAPLVRPELAAPLLLVAGWSWLRTRRVPWLPIGVAAATSGGWMLFRIWYYADLFPNTFHLKDGVRLDWGLAYLHDALVPYGAYVLWPALAVLALVLAARGRPVRLAPRALLLVVALVVGAYVVRIGGDGRHYRYLAFPFCLITCASAGLLEHGLAVFAPRVVAPRVVGGRVVGGRVGRAAVLAVSIAAGVVFAWLHPRQLSAHPLGSEVVESKLGDDGVIHDAEYHRAKEDIGFSPWSSGRETERIPADQARLIYDDYGEPPPERELWLFDEYARYISEVRPQRPPPTGAGSWCYDIWLRFSQRVIHKDGLTDAVLARTVAEPWRPGHYKWLGLSIKEMARIQDTYGWRVGGYRAAVEAGDAAPWVVDNLASLELIERKIHNRHDLLENLRLAFTPVEPIVGPRPPTD